MSFIDDVRRDREELARVLKKHSGIRRIVEDLYPDSAHFIYELLQNADDTRAEHVTFNLHSEGLIFEHNGRPFSEADIWGITDIGEGTKPNDVDQIGRFGVGFKAVFAYSETPSIWSPTHSFQIKDLVLPWKLEKAPELGGNTRFEFPFNNGKKSKDDAFNEVKSGLADLAETTLLFLNNLESIKWTADDVTTEILRVQHSTHHIEVLKEVAGSRTVSSHFLKFEAPVVSLPNQRVSVAFAMVPLSQEREYDANIALNKQFRIAPVTPGQVAVYFPAEKETSGLKFHIHAPFVPELSRASIKQCDANIPLVEQIAEVVARSLHRIKHLELLTVDFLGVLPNRHDNVTKRYKVIEDVVVAEMKSQPLTPTHSGSYAPANLLRNARATLKETISAKDLQVLIDCENNELDWVANAPLKNGDIDKFLSSLDIKRWDVQDLLGTLVIACGRKADPNTAARFQAWIGSKPSDWHQRFYSLLYNEIKNADAFVQLQNCTIVRLRNGSYGLGSDCFFPSETVGDEDVLPRVDPEVFTYGKNSTQRQASRRFLEEVGVRTVGEAEVVESILKQRYASYARFPGRDIHTQDLKRFVLLVEKNSASAKLFQSYYIFERDDGAPEIPSKTYLDSPFLDTGLHAYYRIQKTAGLKPLASWYNDSRIPVESLRKFAIAVGVTHQLPITETRCKENPEWAYLRMAPGGKVTSNSIDRDFTIVGLKNILEKPTLEVSQLIWRTMVLLRHSPNHLLATYRKNRSSDANTAASQLVYELRRTEWVPQTDGRFVRPSEASRELLPDGFPFDAGWEWIKAVQFGQAVVRRTEEYQRKRALASELGSLCARIVETVSL